MKSKIIVTNGAFDVLHAGHLQLLQYCRSLCIDHKLCVLLDTDEKIKKDKGENRPIFSFDERAKNLYSTNLVDIVYEFESNERLYELIKNINPEIIIKGFDWENKKVIGSDIAKVVFFRYTIDISTTKIINKVIEKINA